MALTFLIADYLVVIYNSHILSSIVSAEYHKFCKLIAREDKKLDGLTYAVLRLGIGVFVGAHILGDLSSVCFARGTNSKKTIGLAVHEEMCKGW